MNVPLFPTRTILSERFFPSVKLAVVVFAMQLGLLACRSSGDDGQDKFGLAANSVPTFIECVDLPDVVDQTFAESLSVGHIFASVDLVPVDNRNEFNVAGLCCLCLINFPDGNGLPASLRIRVTPKIEGRILSPWVVLFPANDPVILLVVPLKPVESLATWRGGRRTKPKPIDKSLIKNLTLRFSKEGKKESKVVDESKGSGPPRKGVRYRKVRIGKMPSAAPE